MVMLHTAKANMDDTITESDIADFLTNAVWAVCSTYHTVLKTSPGAAIFGREILFDVHQHPSSTMKKKLIPTHHVRMHHLFLLLHPLH